MTILKIPTGLPMVICDPKTGVIRPEWYRYLAGHDPIISIVGVLSSGKIWIGSASNVPTEQTVSGDITLSTAGVATIGANKVDNTMLADMVQATIKGRAAAAGTGDPTDLTAAQVVAIINATLDHGALAGLSDNDHPQYLLVADIDDVPVDAEIAQPISSNWAFDHVAAADPHPGYRLESVDHTHQSTGEQAGQLDHGLALTGLTDDDHTQYLLAAGTRALSADWDAGSFEIRAQTFESDVTTGTAPLVIASTTAVTNLNADLLDGSHAAAFQPVDAQLTSLAGLAYTGNASKVIRVNAGETDFELADVSATAVTIANEATDTSCFVNFTTAATGDLGLKSNAGLTFDSSTGTLTATAFVGPLTGNVTGNVSGTAATVTGAAQTAITSVGTLTALQVDNININGNEISSTAGTDLLITPLAGQQIVLDGTIVVDAGVVTGATSISSTVFVGALTGNADTATALATARTIGGTSFDGTANIVPATITVANEAADTTCFIAFATAASGNLGPKTNANMTFDSSTGIVTFASSVLTTTDINGGTVDGVTIGGAVRGAVSCTTLDANGAVTLGDASGDTVTLNAGTVVLNNTATIRADTADASDDQALHLAGGGAVDISRGAFISLYGNENAQPGIALLRSGNAVNSAASLESGTAFFTCNFNLGVEVGGTSLSPSTNDGTAIGTTTLGWSDLHLATGGTINVANGDAVITHSAGIFTVSTGDLRVTTAGTNAASAVTVGGTQTLTAKTLTAPTINGTVATTGLTLPAMTLSGTVTAGAQVFSNMGVTYIGDTSNANNAAGLTINQGGLDDHALTLKSSDITTGLTSSGSFAMETDDILAIQKVSATVGGVDVAAVRTSGNLALQISAFGGTATTADATTTVGPVNFRHAEHDGANALVDAPANANLATWQSRSASAWTTRMLLKADDGELHLGNTTLVALDDEDDVQLVRAMQKTSAARGMKLTELDNPFYDYDKLLAVGLAGEKDERGEFLFPLQPRLHAHEGAIWQLYKKLVDQGKEISRLTQRLALLEN